MHAKERLYISSGLGTPLNPQEKLESVAEEKNIWNILFNLLPPSPDLE